VRREGEGAETKVEEKAGNIWSEWEGGGDEVEREGRGGKVKVKFSPLQALEALWAVRGWGSHIF
jgi:hypothetical protein